MRNAVDFLTAATADFEKRPKHAVIAFYTAVELFLKARLMGEHWSLVVTQKADLNSFRSGDFQSVGFEEACNRLSKIVGSGLSPATLRAFDELRKHRNKMVHFFHEGETKKAVLEQIALEQLTAWHALSALIRVQWADFFRPLNVDLAAIDKTFQRHRLYLKARFETLADEIKALKSAGKTIGVCGSCKFEAAEVADIRLGLVGSKCLVCRMPNRWIDVPCPECAEPLRIEGDDGATCKDCSTVFSVDRLVSELDEDDSAPDEYMFAVTPANCADCEGFHTVVTFKDYYLCLACLNDVDRLGQCGWCHENNTGDMTDSQWRGCSVCEGQSGWEGDR